MSLFRNLLLLLIVIVATMPAFSQEDRRDFTRDDSIQAWYGTQALKSKVFYDSLKNIAYKRKITSVLYNLAFKSPSSSGKEEPVITSTELPYFQMAGKIIHEIKIIRLPPFSPDSIRDFQGFLNRIGNNLHTMTKNSVIRRELLLKQGKALDPLLVADNERLLRSLPFIDEANIQILETSAGSDSVDIIVVTKDKFSYAFSATAKNTQKFSVRFWSVNVLGLGHRFDNKISVNTGRSPIMRYDKGSYEVSNIGGSFIRGLLQYSIDDSERREIKAELARDFIPPTFNDAYGIRMGITSYPATIAENENATKEINIGYYNTDLYYTNGTPLRNLIYSAKHPAYLLLSARTISLDYYARPFINADSNLGFRNRMTFLGGIALARNNYFITNYVYGFGKTEDIPYGFIAQLIGGFELGEFYNRPYAGVLLGYGDYFRNIGYFNTRLELGTYFRNENVQQGLLRISGNYATPVLKTGRSRIRNYLNIAYTQGFQRLPGEVIRMDDRDGFEGLDINDLLGQKRLIAGAESILYTPWYIYGFSLAVYGFVNAGILCTENQPIFRNRLYTGLGLGIRIRNENLVFNTLQIQFAYFPVAPPGAGSTNFSLSGIPEKTVPGFYSNAPSIPSFY